MGVPRLHPAVEIFELHIEYGCLDLIEPEISADDAMVVLGLAAMHTQHPHALREHRVIGGAEAGIPESAQIFRWEKRETADVPDAARHPPMLVLGTDCLGSILDDVQPQTARQIHEGIHLADLAIEVHRHDGLDPPTGPAMNHLPRGALAAD